MNFDGMTRQEIMNYYLEKRKRKKLRKILKKIRYKNNRHKKRVNWKSNVSDIFLYELFKSSNNCPLCGVKLYFGKEMKRNQATIDHIVPIGRGGGHVKNNIRIVCRHCNCERNYKD